VYVSSKDLDFKRHNYYVVVLIVFNGLRWEVVVSFW